MEVTLGSQQANEYFNFMQGLRTEATKKQYGFILRTFLKHHNIDLPEFLKLPTEDITRIITRYLNGKNASEATKKTIFHTLKHACDMNDVILNWVKIRKFGNTDTRTGNEIAGDDRGYTHTEIQTILNFCDQRLKTAFLILASTGIRIGALGAIKIADLQKVDDIYRVIVYRGSKDRYVTFTTPECTKEIDNYLEFRARRGETITDDSYLIVKRFKHDQEPRPFTGTSLRDLLGDYIEKTGLREIDHKNPYKRKEVPLLHGFRKFFTTQLVKADLKTESRWLLEGHNLKGNDGSYVKLTEQDLLSEYYKAIPLLTISNEGRLKFKLEERIKIEKTQMESMQQDLNKFKEELAAMKRRRKN